MVDLVGREPLIVARVENSVTKKSPKKQNAKILDQKQQFEFSAGMHKTQNIKKTKKNKTNKTYYTEPGKCCICVFFFPPAAVFGGNMSAVAALMLARETQRIEAQGTHEGVVA